MIELVDFNEIYNKEAKDTAAKKTRRSRRSGAGTGAAKKTEAAATEAPVAETAAETTEETPVAEAAPEATASTETEAPAQEEGTEENNA